MTGRRPPEIPFADVADRDDQETLADLVAELQGDPPSAETRARTLRSVGEVTRLGLHAPEVARLLGVTEARADAVLRLVDAPERWSPGFLPGMTMQHLPEDTVVPGTATGFIRLPPEATFPDHRHLGEEHTLVLQGRLRDADGSEHGPGDLLHYPGGSSHAFTVLPGPPLVYLFIVREGLEVAGQTLRVDDPSL